VVVFLLIATISSAFDRWTESRYPAGAILVKPTSFTDPSSNELLLPETMDHIRATPGVVAVVEHYRGTPSVLFRGRSIPLNAQSMDVVATHGHIPTVDRSSSDVARDLHRGAIAISTGFAKIFASLLAT
jgi:hypothetical protein